MATIRDIRRGLQIFEDHHGTDCTALHDVLYAGQAEGEALTESEVQTLIQLGWMISEYCAGCAKDGQPSFATKDGDRHAYTCAEWMIFP